MHSFNELVKIFAERFAIEHFPKHPATLYEPGDYFLSLGGKRIRPVICLMGNELFADINPDAFNLSVVSPPITFNPLFALICPANEVKVAVELAIPIHNK